MYRVDRNNFYKNQANATIYTPKPVAQFLYQIIAEQLKTGLILDPCVGSGRLLEPFQKTYKTIGIDVEDQGFPNTKVKDFLTIKKWEEETPGLVIMNPPFNVDNKTKEYIKKHHLGRPLMPEVFLEKTIELFGPTMPIILFTPYGFRLNQMVSSKRWQKFMTRKYPEISSIISLPKDIYEGVLFHSEILLFNFKGLKAHYFYPQQ